MAIPLSKIVVGSALALIPVAHKVTMPAMEAVSHTFATVFTSAFFLTTGIAVAWYIGRDTIVQIRYYRSRH